MRPFSKIDSAGYTIAVKDVEKFNMLVDDANNKKKVLLEAQKAQHDAVGGEDRWKAKQRLSIATVDALTAQETMLRAHLTIIPLLLKDLGLQADKAVQDYNKSVSELLDGIMSLGFEDGARIHLQRIVEGRLGPKYLRNEDKSRMRIMVLSESIKGIENELSKVTAQLTDLI